MGLGHVPCACMSMGPILLGVCVYPCSSLCMALLLFAYISLVQLYTELCISNVNVYRGVKYCMRKWALKQIRVVKIWRISDVVCKP